ncbi:hypothetical protein BGU32_18450 [Clostridioides difficile]|nr:hypothetical protein BGU32_18450 [Clostridioides difficile]
MVAVSGRRDATGALPGGRSRRGAILRHLPRCLPLRRTSGRPRPGSADAGGIADAGLRPAVTYHPAGTSPG